MKRQQRGFSFVGLLFASGVMACILILGAQVLPTLVEYETISKAATKSLAGNTPSEVRAIFDKAGQIDSIRSISGKDLEVTKEGEKTVVSFAYTREIHLAGPAYLLLKYNGRFK